MKKYLLTIAIVGCAAFCVSAIRPPADDRCEVAMAKCTKQTAQIKSQDKQKKNEVAKNETKRKAKKAWPIRNGYSKEEYKPEASEIAAKRKSAAQKVMEGY